MVSVRSKTEWEMWKEATVEVTSDNRRVVTVFRRVPDLSKFSHVAGATLAIFPASPDGTAAYPGIWDANRVSCVVTLSRPCADCVQRRVTSVVPTLWEVFRRGVPGPLSALPETGPGRVVQWRSKVSAPVPPPTAEKRTANQAVFPNPQIGRFA